MRLVYKFHFNKGVDISFIETQLINSIMTSVDVFGQPKVELSTTYFVRGQEAALEVSGIAGLHTLLVFAGLLSRSIGVDRYSMQYFLSLKGAA